MRQGSRVRRWSLGKNQLRRSILPATRVFRRGSSRLDRTIPQAKRFRPVRQPDLLEALALGHDAIVKGNVRCPAAQLLHHKRTGRFLRDVQSLAVAIRSEEHVVLHARINGFAKHRLDVDHGFSTRQLPAARIFEPALRSVNGIERDLLGPAPHRSHLFKTTVAAEVAAHGAVALATETAAVSEQNLRAAVVGLVILEPYGRKAGGAVVVADERPPVIRRAECAEAELLAAIAPNSDGIKTAIFGRSLGACLHRLPVDAAASRAATVAVHADGNASTRNVQT